MYKITFADNTHFLGGEPDNSHWNDIPHKGIVGLEYSLLGVNIMLRGFEAYNHIVERAIILNPKNGMNSERITRIILMGKWQKRVYKVIYDLVRQKVIKEVEISSIQTADLGVTGWIDGHFDQQHTPRIRQI